MYRDTLTWALQTIEDLKKELKEVKQERDFLKEKYDEVKYNKIDSK